MTLVFVACWLVDDLGFVKKLNCDVLAIAALFHILNSTYIFKTNGYIFSE